MPQFRHSHDRYWIMRIFVPLLVLLCWLAAPTAGWANCRNGTTIRYGETLEGIAQRCGVNIEALKQANPGIQIGPPQNGIAVQVPSPPLPSPMARGSGKGIIGPVTRPGTFGGQIEVRRP